MTRKHLWRVGVLPEYEFGEPNRRALYVVAKTKEKAKEYAEKHLESPYRVGKISRLGEQLAASIFRE